MVVWIFLIIFVSSCTLISKSKDDVKDEIDAETKKEVTTPIVCGVGTALNQQTNQCVLIKSDEKIVDLPKVVPSVPTPPSGTNVICREPSGVFTSLYYRQRNRISGTLCGDDCKADILGMFRYQGNCPADVYIEAGIPNTPISASPLSVPSGFSYATKGSPSACDGNVHFNGALFKNVQPNQVLIFELQPEHYGVEGSYPLRIGAYTGCLKDGGKEIQIPQKSWLVGFSNQYNMGGGNNLDIGNSWVKVI